MSLQVSVDRELCYGSGSCVNRQPGVFAWDDEGFATVVGDGAALGEDELLTISVSCPAAAITVTDGDRVLHHGGI